MKHFLLGKHYSLLDFFIVGGLYAVLEYLT